MPESRTARHATAPCRRNGGWAAALSAVMLAVGSAGLLLTAATPAAATTDSIHAIAGFHGALPVPARAKHPDLTADTPAACNRLQPPGDARCFAIVRTPSDHVITADSSGPPSGALGPADIQSAYNLPSATAGTGETVAVVDAYNDPKITADLATFRSQYGLPACTTASGCLEVVNQNGQPSPLPPDAGSTGWDVEESLDVEAVSAACPECHILLVEADNSSNANAAQSEDTAVSLGAVAVSNSYGDYGHPGENQAETKLDKYYNHPGVAVTASAGDGGYGVNYPSGSQYVTAAGGTTLTKDTSVPRGWDETVWNDFGATGSGCSAYEQRPFWQAGITQDCAMRATADVSADADPASGLAVYDSYSQGGWLQVGGTSLSSPLIAATDALAFSADGAPPAGTYPSSYLYAHYLGDPSVFNDVTSGSDGACGNVLCTAGPGWDGPTGLGTPDGVTGFSHVPVGSVTGTVTDSSTGDAIAGASVSVPRLQVATGSTGSYTLSGLPAGSYQVTVSAYGYQDATATVSVTQGQATTQNIQLTASPHETVSGKVKAGTGTAWPLYAQVSWSDGNGHGGTAYTTPATGKYSLSLLENGSYTLTVTPLYPGYSAPAAQTVTVDTSSVTKNFTAAVDTLTCTAIGYHPVLSGGSTQPFTGTSVPKGWTVSNINLHYPGYSYTPGWEFSNPGKRANGTGGAGNFAIVDSDHDGALHYQDTYLTSPAVNLSADKSPAVQFATDLLGATNSTATVAVSVNGGQTWSRVWANAGAAGAPGPVTVVVPLPQAAGKADVRVRFSYTGEWSGYWEIDNVFLGNRICTQPRGALLTGRVADASGAAVNGATVASVTNPAEKATTMATPGNTGIDGGLYDLFVTETGSQQYTASASGYVSGTQSATITAGQVTRLNFTMTATAPGGTVSSCRCSSSG